LSVDISSAANRAKQELKASSKQPDPALPLKRTEDTPNSLKVLPYDMDGANLGPLLLLKMQNGFVRCDEMEIFSQRLR
jgi:hypothetical protein